MGWTLTDYGLKNSNGLGTFASINTWKLFDRILWDLRYNEASKWKVQSFSQTMVFQVQHWHPVLNRIPAVANEHTKSEPQTSWLGTRQDSKQIHWARQVISTFKVATGTLTMTYTSSRQTDMETCRHACMHASEQKKGQLHRQTYMQTGLNRHTARHTCLCTCDYERVCVCVCSSVCMYALINCTTHTRAHTRTHVGARHALRVHGKSLCRLSMIFLS